MTMGCKGEKKSVDAADKRALVAHVTGRTESKTSYAGGAKLKSRTIRSAHRIPNSSSRHRTPFNESVIQIENLVHIGGLEFSIPKVIGIRRIGNREYEVYFKEAI